MANIDTELQTIATAIYGRDMRGAIHDAIEKVNDDVIDTHRTYTETDYVTSGSDTLYLYSITFHSLSDTDSDVAINTVEVEIDRVMGRTGYPLEPGITDEGVILCDIPDTFYAGYDFKLPVVPMGDAIIDLPYLFFDHVNKKIRFVNGFNEILGDVMNVMAHGTYFTT